MDMAWYAVRTHLPWWWVGNSWSGLCGPGWEATVKGCGVAVAMPRGYSRVPHSSTGHQ
jgi:hypothetical protein